MTCETIAETAVAGFASHQATVVERLVVAIDRNVPSLTVRHEKEREPDDWRRTDGYEEVLSETVVTPSNCDGSRRIQGGSKAAKDRVIIEHHDHAPRAYVRHERRELAGWEAQRAWELHPVTGVEQVGRKSA